MIRIVRFFCGIVPDCICPFREILLKKENSYVKEMIHQSKRKKKLKLGDGNGGKENHKQEQKDQEFLFF